MPLWGNFFLAAALCAAALIALSPLAHRVALLDEPGGRKLHTGAVPLIGGVAIGISFLLVQFAAPAYPVWLAAGVVWLLVIGIDDDRSDRRAVPKLAAQTAAALLMIFGGGVHIASLGSIPTLDGGGELLIGYWGIPLTIIAVVGLINAFNMLDGLDGLAGGHALLTLFHIAAAMHLLDRPPAPQNLFDILIFAGALVGFLAFNLGLIPNRKVFLGDAGSWLIGFFLAWLIIRMTQTTPAEAALPVAIAPWLIALPILETLTLMYRRLRDKRSPFASDRDHLHHLLLANGLSVGATRAAMLALSVALFWLGYALLHIDPLLAGIVFIFAPPVYYRLITRKLRKTRTLSDM